MWYTITRLTWETISAFSPSDIIMRFVSWAVYGTFFIFILLNLPIYDSTPVRPAPSEDGTLGQCQPEDDPPNYEDVVATCIEIESEVAVRQHELPPPSYTLFV